MSEPLPCPFCGHIGLDFEDGSTHRWGVASCGGCGASTGEVRRAYPDDGKWHSEAIVTWNCRAQPQSSTSNQVEVGTTVQAGQMLTDAEIQAAWVEHGLDDCTVEDFARAIEAAVLAKRVPQWLPIEALRITPWKALNAQ